MTEEGDDTPTLKNSINGANGHNKESPIHHIAAASAIIAMTISKDNIRIMQAQEPWAYQAHIRGLQGGIMKVIWDSSSEKPRIFTSRSGTL